MDAQVKAKLLQGIQIEILDVLRRRLQDYLELIVALETVGVLAVAAVGRAAGRLNVGAVMRLGSDSPEEGHRV